MKLPEGQFMLFGMGARRKLLYRRGALVDALTNEILRGWEVATERFEPSEYRVTLETKTLQTVRIEEDTKGVWIEQDGRRECMASGALKLPRFERSPHARLLRRLHQEILINVVDGKPVPNLWVYSRPWYRDGAMMLMCLHTTGNLHVVKDWVQSLREPFDRNNAGHTEPDNLGQALYMLALCADAHHPLAQTVLDVLPRFEKTHDGQTYIEGMSDFAPHPVYQTKWLKYGLRALKLPDRYSLPSLPDSYSGLFWMDYRRQHVADKGFGWDDNYPYLSWAYAHFNNAHTPAPIDETQWSLSWEAHASQADYSKMAVLNQEYVARKVCAPHTWHTAEMFLYYLNRSSG